MIGPQERFFPMLKRWPAVPFLVIALIPA